LLLLSIFFSFTNGFKHIFFNSCSLSTLGFWEFNFVLTEGFGTHFGTTGGGGGGGGTPAFPFIGLLIALFFPLFIWEFIFVILGEDAIGI